MQRRGDIILKKAKDRKGERRNQAWGGVLNGIGHVKRSSGRRPGNLREGNETKAHGAEQVKGLAVHKLTASTRKENVIFKKKGGSNRELYRQVRI